MTSTPISADELRRVRHEALGLHGWGGPVPGPSMPGAGDPAAVSGPAVAPSQADVVTAVADVGRRFLAMQGQDFAGVRWALGCRVPAAVHSDVRAVLDAGLLVRSWPMRGTIHVVPGEDIGWVQSLTSERLTGASAQRRREYLGLELATLERAREVAVEVLAGRRALSREALMATWCERIPEMRTEWSYHVVWFLAQTGTLCQGPMLDDREQALVLVDDWVPHPRRLDREEALTELARRYVGAHGAVSIKDFVWWTGLPQRDLKQGVADAGDVIVTRQGEDGVTYLMDAELAETSSGTGAGSAGEAGAGAGEGADGPEVLLLPAFDEHLLGYTDRSWTLAVERAPQVCPGNNGVFRPTVVVDGETLGTWKKEPARVRDAGPRLTVTPFDARAAKRLRSRAVKAPLAAAARAYARFLTAPSGTPAGADVPVEVSVAAL